MTGGQSGSSREWMLCLSQRCSMSGDIRAVSSWPLLELYMEKEAQWDLVYFSLSLNVAHIKHATDIYTINAYTNCVLV